MQYTVLQGTGLPNPPEERIGVFVGSFPVRSLATRSLLKSEKDCCPDPGGQARPAPKLKRPLSFDGLDKEVRDALSEEWISVFDLTTTPPDPQKVKRISNPFRLADKSEAVLENEGQLTQPNCRGT